MLHVGPEPPPRDEEGIYSCDGPAQFLVDTCLGRDVPEPRTGRARDPDGGGDGGGVGVGAQRPVGSDRCARSERRLTTA